jgi:hypothetical protein
MEAVEAVLDTRGSIRLFVNVAVPLMVVKPLEAFAVFPNAVATLVPNPATPVDIGNPVQLAKFPEEGVPSTGVKKVGLIR